MTCCSSSRSQNIYPYIFHLRVVLFDVLIQKLSCSQVHSTNAWNNNHVARVWVNVEDWSFGAQEYLAYSIFCGYIIFNNNWRYGGLKEWTNCWGVYILIYYCKLNFVFQKYHQKVPSAFATWLSFIMIKPEPILNIVENIMAY